MVGSLVSFSTKELWVLHLEIAAWAIGFWDNEWDLKYLSSLYQTVPDMKTPWVILCHTEMAVIIYMIQTLGRKKYKQILLCRMWISLPCYKMCRVQVLFVVISLFFNTALLFAWRNSKQCFILQWQDIRVIPQVQWSYNKMDRVFSYKYTNTITNIFS